MNPATKNLDFCLPVPIGAKSIETTSLSKSLWLAVYLRVPVWSISYRYISPPAIAMTTCPPRLVPLMILPSKVAVWDYAFFLMCLYPVGVIWIRESSLSLFMWIVYTSSIIPVFLVCAKLSPLTVNTTVLVNIDITNIVWNTCGMCRLHF